MKTLTLICAAAMLAGCATTKPTNGNSDPDLARVRTEIARQYAYLGIDPALADNAIVSIQHCAASGESSDGPYVCAESSCSQIGTGCVHAWESNSFHSDRVRFMFAGLAKDWCIRHEVGHFTQHRWGDNLAELSPNNGHPVSFHFNGKLIKTKDLIAGARWPAVVRGLKFWRRAEGSEFGCAILTESGEVKHLKPMPQQGLEGI